MQGLQEHFGQIDIYVFDQLLRSNLRPGMRVLDAGCGNGRNLVYLLQAGYEIFACDASPDAVAYVRALAASLGNGLPAENVQQARLEALPYPDSFADVVLCNSVLHFADDAAHFHAMVRELWRTVRPGGMLFCRLGSRIGMDFYQLPDGKYRMPDGSEWFLVSEDLLMDVTAGLGAALVDPLKTSVVQGLRCMTTWVLRKPLT